MSHAAAGRPGIGSRRPNHGPRTKIGLVWVILAWWGVFMTHWGIVTRIASLYRPTALDRLDLSPWLKKYYLFYLAAWHVIAWPSLHNCVAILGK